MTFRKLIFAAAAAAVYSTPLQAHAAPFTREPRSIFLGFEDLTPGTRYDPFPGSNSILTNGIPITVSWLHYGHVDLMTLQPPISPALPSVVVEGGARLGSGNSLLVMEAALDFGFETPLDEFRVDLRSVWGDDIMLELNGSSVIVQNLFQLDDIELGGVHVDVIADYGGRVLGCPSDQAPGCFIPPPLPFTLVLTGIISDFVIGGERLYLDNAAALPSPSVPEPATLFLLGSGIIGILTRRKAG